MTIEKIETERLILEALTLKDAGFINALFNDPDSLRYIGDKQIHDKETSENYLQEGPLASYVTNGFGILKVSIKSSQVPIGCCGLLQRDYLTLPDIGFSSLPEFRGQGFLYEAGQAVLEQAKASGFDEVYAIVSPENLASINLLEKLGFGYKERLSPEVDDRVTDIYHINF